MRNLWNRERLSVSQLSGALRQCYSIRLQDTEDLTFAQRMDESLGDFVKLIADWDSSKNEGFQGRDFRDPDHLTENLMTVDKTGRSIGTILLTMNNLPNQCL